MSPLELLIHLVNGALPAVAMALLLTPWILRGVKASTDGRRRALRVLLSLVAVGVLVLAGGLVVFERDGKMATYAALVVAMGSLSAYWRARLKPR